MPFRGDRVDTPRRAACPTKWPTARAGRLHAEVPYPGLAFPQTHPDRLALLATLHGLEPAAPDSARILEVGARRLNLVAMAGHSPGLTAVGFDVVDPALGARRRRPGAGERPPRAGPTCSRARLG